MSFGLESKLETFGSNRCDFMRHGMGEWMISACVFPTVKHGGGGVMVWGCFSGDTVYDLFRIQGTLNQHDYHLHSASIRHPIYIGKISALIGHQI